MTREIKFRAWDIYKKQMYPVKTISYEYDDSIGNKDFEWCVQYGTDETPMPNELGNKMVWHIYRDGSGKTCELMQYIGLKDKNGKNIYEGDIVKYKILKVQAHPVIFADVSRGYNTPEFKIDCGSIHGNLLTKHSIESWGIEVIGNIYKNPDLLY